MVDPERHGDHRGGAEDVGRQVLQEDAARAVREGARRVAVRVGILGPLVVERDGEPVEIAGERIRALLTRLARDAPRPVSTGALVDAVWGNDLPADEQHALQSLVSRARRSVGDVLEATPGGYRLAIAADDVDAHRFARLVDEGRPRDALALWRGPNEFEELRVRALLAAADVTVDELEAALAEHPLNERLAARYIQALAAAGRQADALAAYERVRARLSEELGAAPSPELADAHLAVLNAKRRTNNLRAAVTSFVGRAADVERIGALLADARLVTLVGPGGAGKTRLATEALRGRDDVWMVELAPVTAEVEIAPAILAALGVGAVVDRPGTAPRHGVDRLIDVLVDRETVLILDNCEHLIGAVATLADTLLGACPLLRIVATSREPLAIAGENLVPVAPLDVEPAVELFLDRARAASPGFAPTPEVHEICRRLDGLPLAIELAAARLRTLPVHEIAARLDDRFRLLTAGSRAALPRHRTLRAVVDWSWDLLDERERVLARRLAVFQAGADEEAAAAVCGVPDALDGLTALAERSLVVPGERYRMLETIREYALEKLAEAGEVEAVRTAHARWFAEVVDRTEPRLRGHGQREAFRRLQAEKDDVIAALRWLGERGDARGVMRLAVKLLWFWVLSGSPEEALTWIRYALTVEGEADPVDRLIAEGITEIVAVMGDHARGGDALEGLAQRVEAVDTSDRPLIALARVMLAVVVNQTSFAEARLAETLEHPDPWVRATATLMRAHLAENQGDQTHMRADLERAAAMYRELGDEWALAMTLASLAGTMSLTDELDEAETVLDEAMERLDALNGSTGTGLLRMRLSEIRVRRGDTAGARALAAASLKDTEFGGRDAQVFARASLARFAALDGDLDELRRQAAEAVRSLERLGPLRPEQGHAKALVEALRATVAMADGDMAAAHRWAQQAIATALGTSDMPIVATAGVARATVEHRAGELEAAATTLGAAAVLRGAEDLSSPEIARLAEARRHPAYARALALAREDAIAWLSRPAVVGAQGERHEDRE